MKSIVFVPLVCVIFAGANSCEQAEQESVDAGAAFRALSDISTWPSGADVSLFPISVLGASDTPGGKSDDMFLALIVTVRNHHDAKDMIVPTAWIAPKAFRVLKWDTRPNLEAKETSLDVTGLPVVHVPPSSAVQFFVGTLDGTWSMDSYPAGDYQVTHKFAAWDRVCAVRLPDGTWIDDL